jgi:hypothetical protein
MYPRKKQVKKAIYGAAISAGLGIVTSGIQGVMAAKEAKKAKAVADTNNFNTAVKEQDIYANEFQDTNLNALPVYANGGGLNTTDSNTTGKYETKGGDLTPISENAEVVDGNTHEENKIDDSYGVTLSENGEPVANVEDKEVVVDGNLVFSDTLKKGGKTFAELALEVNSKIGELQVRNKETIKPAEKFSNERTIQGLEKMNQDLFSEQELVKANTVGTKEETVDVVDGSVPVAKNGMDINKNNYLTDPKSNNSDVYSKIGTRKESFGKDLAPLLVDNLTNLVLTANAPKAVAPITKRAPIYDTKVNVNPQLANVASAIGSGNETIRANTNNSAVARANITANNLRGMEANNNIFANKQAQERQLKNQQMAANTAVANDNAQMSSDYQNDVRDRTIQQNSAYSANVTNAIEDVTAVRTNEMQKNTDDMSIELALLDDPTGEKARTYMRMNRNVGTKSRATIIQELERMDKFNKNKRK